jgi:hypothetical protein
MKVILGELKAKPHLALGVCGILLLVGVLVTIAFWLQRLEYQHNLALANAMTIAKVNEEQAKIIQAVKQLAEENRHRVEEIRESKQDRASIRKDVGQAKEAVQTEKKRNDGIEPRVREIEERP